MTQIYSFEFMGNNAVTVFGPRIVEGKMVYNILVKNCNDFTVYEGNTLEQACYAVHKDYQLMADEFEGFISEAHRTLNPSTDFSAKVLDALREGYTIEIAYDGDMVTHKSVRKFDGCDYYLDCDLDWMAITENQRDWLIEVLHVYQDKQSALYQGVMFDEQEYKDLFADGYDIPF